MHPPAGDNEIERLNALKRYHILDTPPEESFDTITALAAEMLDFPIAVTSLVDTDRIWFKSHHGLDVQQIGRDPGLCSSAILSGNAYVIEDAQRDPRSRKNPLVTSDFGLRCYAAIPLRTRDNFGLGTLCVIDMEPRKVHSSKVDTLSVLARLVMDQMELRLAGWKIAQLGGRASRELVEPLRDILRYSRTLEKKAAGMVSREQLEMITAISLATEEVLGMGNRDL